MFDENQKKQILERSISIDEALRQVRVLQEGFPFIEIDRPGTLGDGIFSVCEKEEIVYLDRYQEAALQGRISLFVPASGAASRMFKALLSVVGRKLKSMADLRKGTPDEKTIAEFFHQIEHFPFYENLRQCLAKDGFDLKKLCAKDRHSTILEYLLLEKGLNYAQLPKGLIGFHQSPEGYLCTAFEEHLLEACQYACDQNKNVKIHFTIASEFQTQIETIISRGNKKLKQQGYHIEIEYSEQKASTDTLALDEKNQLFLEDGKLLFRPGGHGALIENLNEVNGDIVFIKNIDNILPAKANKEVVKTQRLLGGMLVVFQNRIFDFLKKIKANNMDENLVQETLLWTRDCFGFDCANLTGGALESALFDFLNRPIRVCGMVANEGEPGGGPFWSKNSEGRISLQIIEKSQIDFNLSEQKQKAEQATHFNPVNLVCGLKDYQGKAFDLKKYIDENTGFVSEKSFNGKSLKALERPGLWNGAMANWLTVFVDVPLETFAPVKELNDLLRPAHQKWRVS